MALSKFNADYAKWKKKKKVQWNLSEKWSRNTEDSFSLWEMN